ncbi:MAG: hypothetical protein KC422_26245, partial [Trueperaceae bacterium]|nr:hypothetical protein [Trueperaceae bacterium]
AAPDYNKVRDEANFNGHTLGDYLTNPLLCTHSFVPAIVPANAVICTSGDIDLSNKVIGTSSVIITDGKISSSGGANLTNVSLISKTSSISMSGGNTLTNVRFFSESGITLSGGTAVAGKSTVASGGNITLSGGTKPVEAIGSDGKTKVGIAIIGAGKIVLSGGSVYYGSIWGGSSVTLSGGTSVFGGIATTGDISLTGGAFVDTNVSVNNDELPKTDSKGLTVLSRR